MSDCEFLKTCVFFNDKMAGMPSTSEIIKLRYCKGDNSDCARFVVCQALGREKVPADLFPNHGDRARTLLAQG